MKTDRFFGPRRFGAALCAAALIAGAFLLMGATAYAAAEPPAENTSPIAEETLSVDEVRMTGDTLHITVTDKTGGESKMFELNLSDYAKPGDEYVTVRAADKDGRVSDAIRFKNPYYAPQTDAASASAEDPPAESAVSSGGEPAETPGESESAVPDGAFTPDGTGSVVDNAAESDGKEFFTVETPDGNMFYLIVDRQRTGENVYLLNAVTENDLASLAEPGDGLTSGAVPSPFAPAESAPEPEPEPASEPEPEKGGGAGTLAFIAIAVLVAGGAGYYFKIVRPGKLGRDDEDAYEDEPEDEPEDVFDDGADDYGNDDERSDAE
jgi:hypothetical protein